MSSLGDHWWREMKPISSVTRSLMPLFTAGIVHQVEGHAQAEKRAHHLVARGVVHPEPGRILVNRVGGLLVRNARANGEFVEHDAARQPVVAGYVDSAFSPASALFTFCSAAADRVTL